MNKLIYQVNKKTSSTKLNPISVKEAFRNDEGAIDLASIMVGIIVIGLIGGVIAATVFAVIPWSQDNAAKHQLDSIVAAESAYMGLSSDSPPALPAGHKGNSFANSGLLASANLLQEGKTYCAIQTSGGKSYQGFSQSASGKVWTVTDKNTKPSIYNGTLPSDCSFIAEGQDPDNDPSTATPDTETPYVDPTPTITVLNYMCDVTEDVVIPMNTNLTGTLTWGGSPAETYSGQTFAAEKTLQAGVPYSMTFEGTFSNYGTTDTKVTSGADCLRSVDHWGSEAGAKDASFAFYKATNLTTVPQNIPTGIHTMEGMFNQASTFNQSISSWDVSNVTDMNGMFYWASNFNQPLNSWDVSNVTDMSAMFVDADKFNQPLDKWDVSSVKDMQSLFFNADIFNQPVDSWDVSSVTNMIGTFRGATDFNQPLNSWNVSNVTQIENLFQDASSFNQPLDKWVISNDVMYMKNMFNGATIFNQNLSGWNVDGVTLYDDFATGSALTSENTPKF